MTQPLTAERDGFHAGLERRNRPRVDLLHHDASAWYAAWLCGKAERLARIRRHEILPRELADEITAYFGGVQVDYARINAPVKRREMRKARQAAMKDETSDEGYPTGGEWPSVEYQKRMSACILADGLDGQPFFTDDELLAIAEAE